MNSPADDTPFRLEVGYDQDELLGARWWHERLAAIPLEARRRAARGTQADQSRRETLIRLAGIGGVLLIGGAGLAYCSRSGSGSRTVVTTTHRPAIDVQRERGLTADAGDARFAWPDAIDTTSRGEALDKASLAQLDRALRPVDAAWQPAYVPTLYQCFAAPGGDAFARDFRMVRSAAMQRAFAQGQAVRELLQHAEQPWRWLLVIDLDGPDSIAFAAALQPSATAVFVFDNWPHPRGVVPSHLTLGAAVHHRDDFVVASPVQRSRAPAALVLDRKRLAPNANEPDRFDNRYAAKVPDAAFLRTNGVERVLYVVPDGAPAVELDDLNERFVAWRTAGITVQMLGLADVTQANVNDPARAAGAAAGASSQRYYWHGNPLYHFWFWNHYGWASRAPSGPAPTAPPTSSFGSGWSPARRPTRFDGTARLGTVPEQQRTRGSSGGSWGRSSGGYGG